MENAFMHKVFPHFKVVWSRLRTNLIRILHLAFANTTKPLKFPLESLLFGLRFLVPQKKRQNAHLDYMKPKNFLCFSFKKLSFKTSYKEKCSDSSKLY
jgi:hypothetical protein